jgi:hypothetical protein
MWSPAGLLSAALVLATPVPPPGSTAANEATDDDHQPPEDAQPSEELTGASPAHLIPKLEIRHQFQQPEGGGHAHTTTVRMDILFLRRALLRYELPLVTLEQAGVQSAGIGDIQVQALSSLTSGPRHTALLIAGLTLNTATQPLLGTGKQVVDVGMAAAVKPRAWWLLYGIVDQQLSFAGSEQRADVSQLLASLGSVVFGGQRDWYLLDLGTQADFEQDRARLFGTVETGRLLSGRVGLFVRAGTQLAGQRTLDYMLGAGVRYLFLLPGQDSSR